MTYNNKTSAFRAYLKNTYGGKVWIMALWHEGLSWIPKDCERGSQTAITAFCEWLCRVVEAYTRFQNDERTKTARQKSGNKKGVSGLTNDQHEKRQQYQYIKEQKEKALELNDEFQAHQKWWDTRKYPTDKKWKNFSPRSWYDLTDWERYLLQWWWSGDLAKVFDNAQKAHQNTGSSIAKPFRMDL